MFLNEREQLTLMRKRKFMKFYYRNYIFAVLFIVHFASVSAQADDTYNFYFQKPSELVKPKVQTEPEIKASTQPVESKSPQTEVLPAVQNENPQGASRLELPAMTSKENEFHHWEIMFGRSSFGEAPQEFKGYYWQEGGELAGSQWNLGVQYNFAHHLACDLQIMALQNQSFFSPQNFDFALGLSYMPLRVDLIGRSFLNLGIIAGANSVPIQEGVTYQRDQPNPNGYGNSTVSVFYPTGVSHKILPYYGAKLDLYVGKDISLIGSAKMIPGFNMTQVIGGISIGL